MRSPRGCPRECWRNLISIAFHRRAASALAVACLLSARATAEQHDSVEGQRALVQAGEIEPLPDTGSGITRDIGSIAVIEHDGSNYDARVDGTTNYIARARVAKRFYQTHGDNYDFLLIFTNFEFDTAPALAFFSPVRRDVTGINTPLIDVGASYGSPGRLRGTVDMAALSRYTRPELRDRLSLQPGTTGFFGTLNVMAHEFAHLWLAYVRYLARNPDGSTYVSSAILGRDDSHWSTLLDMDGSVMDGVDWVDNPDGSFTALHVQELYSPLDLYLMGFLAPDKVAPFRLLRSPDFDHTKEPAEGTRISATQEEIKLQQILAVEGQRERTPNHLTSPKTFRAGFIFLTKPGVDVTPQEIEAVERVRQAFTAHFFALTRGVALIDTTLAEAPPAPRATAPDLEKARAWLLTQQYVDGRWQDTNATAVRDSAAVLDALAGVQSALAAHERGRGWLDQSSPSSLDLVARRARTLAPYLSGSQRTALLARIRSLQNPDGGFGLAAGFESDALDTALALRALRALGQTLDANVDKALAVLQQLQRPGPAGGWPVVPDGETSVHVTAHVLLALHDWSASPRAQAILPSGLAALAARRNPDGGFGDSPSSPHTTALSLAALAALGTPTTVLEDTIAWLQATQRPDGSWEGSPYQTALTLATLVESTAANLIVSPDSITIDPTAPREGDLVRVSARVRNDGRVTAAAHHARLYDGPPQSGVLLGDVMVPELPAGTDAPVQFDFSSENRVGDHTLYVVADSAGEVAELREDDNTATRALRIAGELPDLSVTAVDVSPKPVQDGEVAQVQVAVANVGLRPAAATIVRLYDGHPRQGGVPIADASVEALPAGTPAMVTITWNTTGKQGTYQLYAQIDPTFAVAEANEFNNEAFVTVEVEATLAPDFAIESVVAEPSTLTTLPQTFGVKAGVRNRGLATATATIAGYDAQSGQLVMQGQPVTLAARTAGPVNLSLTLSTPGTRSFRVQVEYPEDTRSDNNSASFTVKDAGTKDLALADGQVTFSPTDMVLGSTLTVTAIVRNPGTTLASAPVVLGRAENDGGFVELARTSVSVPPGGSQTVSLYWKADQMGDPLALVVVADPDGQLVETSEDNNRVQRTIRVRSAGKANLNVTDTDLVFDPDPFVLGAPATVGIHIRNTGDVAAGSFVVRFYAYSTLIAETTVLGIPANGTAFASVPWASVTHVTQNRIYAYIDWNSTVPEYDEWSDNDASRQFYTVGFGDLNVAPADIEIEPRLPRKGQTVTLKIKVRNTGGQAVGASILHVFDGEPGTRLVEALDVPALAPTAAASVSATWTLDETVGLRTVSLVVDAGGHVSESDEDNNVTRRTVSIQDTDLFVSERYFSPNGDGIQDEVVFGFSSERPVTPVVLDFRGDVVRRLTMEPQTSASVNWDGRNDAGRPMWDGDYRLAILDETHGALQTLDVTLDTNRSPIHDAAGTPFLARYPLQASAVESMDPHYFYWKRLSPDGLYLYGHNYFSGIFARFGRDGRSAVVSSGLMWNWYEWNKTHTALPSVFSDPISPDGRWILIVVYEHSNTRYAYDVCRMDLRNGARQVLYTYPAGLTGVGWDFVGGWSPDAQRIAIDTWEPRLEKDGTVRNHPIIVIIDLNGQRVAQFDAGTRNGNELRRPAGWRWSPDGEIVLMDAGGGAPDAGGQSRGKLRRFRSDGTEIPIDWSKADAFIQSVLQERLKDYACPPAYERNWRADGRVYEEYLVPRGSIEETNACSLTAPVVDRVATFLLDPAKGSVQDITAFGLATTTRGPNTAGRFFKNTDEPPYESPWNPRPPSMWAPDGSAGLYNASNDPAATEPDAVLVASEDGSTWNTLIPPAVDDFPTVIHALSSDGMTAYEGGLRGAFLTTLLNLTAEFTVTEPAGGRVLELSGTAADKNLDYYQFEYASVSQPGSWAPIAPPVTESAASTVLVTWVPPIPGEYDIRLTVRDRAGNVRTQVRRVQWNTSQVIPIAGVSPNQTVISPNADGVQDAVTFTYNVNAPATLDVRVSGSQGTVWTLRRTHTQLGFTSFTWEGKDSTGTVVPDGRYTVYVNDLTFVLHVDTTPPDIAWAYENLRVVTHPITQWTSIQADRVWHVVDRHLQQWTGPNESGTAEVYVPQIDASGAVVLEDGRPVPARLDGRIVDKRQADNQVSHWGTAPRVFTAIDRGGNRSTTTIEPVPERLFILSAGRHKGPIDSSQLYTLDPVTSLLIAETLRGPSPKTVRFEFQPLAGGPWVRAQPLQITHRNTWTADLEALGARVGEKYRSRFVAETAAGSVYSEELRFWFCSASFSTSIASDTPSPKAGQTVEYSVQVDASVAEPLVKATLVVSRKASFQKTVAMQIEGNRLHAKVLGPWVECPDPDGLIFDITVVGQSGRVYVNDGRCIQLKTSVPTCQYSLALEQLFPFCLGAGDQLNGEVRGATDVPGLVIIQHGEETVASRAVPQGPFKFQIAVASTGLPEGQVELKGRLEPTGVDPVEVSAQWEVDRTPPVLEIRHPLPGAVRQCVTANDGRELIKIVFHGTDAGTHMEFASAEYKDLAGLGGTASLCLDERCEKPWELLPTGTETTLYWDVTNVRDGDYKLSLAFCDPAGNRATVERAVGFQRRAPAAPKVSALSGTFSPNGDGQRDATVVVIQAAEALNLHAVVHQGDLSGPTIRSLFNGEARPAGETRISWNGRSQDGAVVPDGTYTITSWGQNSCGQTALGATTVIVDNTPPSAVLDPITVSTALTTVDVRGVASDANFQVYALSYGLGEAPSEWLPAAPPSGAAVPGPSGLLGRWNRPAEPGTYTLRLAVEDQAGNSRQTTLAVQRTAAQRMGAVSASPEIFSPNADSRQDALVIEYELRAPARVTVQVASTALVRTLESDVVREAGRYLLAWDGNDDAGQRVVDGEYKVVVLARDPNGVDPDEDATVAAVVDTTAPTVSIGSPTANEWVSPQRSVRGTIEDPHLVRYVLTARAEAGSVIELAQGTSVRFDQALALLGPLGEGAHTLALYAEDRAGNQNTFEVLIRVDTETPVARILTPADGAVFAPGSAPITIHGTARDANLSEYVLSFGAGENPGSFVELARGTVGGEGIPLGAWTPVSVPDGVYLLQLKVYDRSGQMAEVRRRIDLDGSAPLAQIIAPASGGYVTGSRAISGTVQDAHLAEWVLEVAPGPANAASGWLPLAGGQAAVDGLLHNWTTIPADGVYTLRLTARDAVGGSTQASSTVTIDTVPPEPPTPVEATLIRKADGTAEIDLTWGVSTSSDLAGYEVARNNIILTKPITNATQLTDAPARHGLYTFAVFAVDAAGNRSEPGQVALTVDLEAPTVAITSPVFDAAVNGAVEVRGMAFSTDLKEYRLLVGAGATPQTWTVFQRGTWPVLNGVLGTWTAGAAGQYRLALEAEDASGNKARTEVRITVDTTRPAAPVISSVAITNVTSLRVTWAKSSSSDSLGTLIYRDGRLVNAPAGTFPPDLTPFLLTGTTYTDASLPDGKYCYRALALDGAGNLSLPSNEVCNTLRNRAPHAEIVEPAAGTRFQYPLRILATSPDLDIASVRFELRPTSGGAWTVIATDTSAPYEAELNPESLSFGDYELRAVATDNGGCPTPPPGGCVDPAPSVIVVTYGSLEPPSAPAGLSAQVDGLQVVLSWAANAEIDLAGYHVYRDGTRITTELVTATTYTDTAALGAYSYRVSAVDVDTNESEPSTAVNATVYALTLLQPIPPFRELASVTLAGSGARAGTVEVLRGETLVGSVTLATPGSFEIADVAVAEGMNIFALRNTDAAGNRSTLSELLVVGNDPPPAVAGLQGTLTDGTADLSWDPVGIPDLQGYLVRRDGVALTASAPYEDSVSASSTLPDDWFMPWRAIDGDEGSWWEGGAGSAWIASFYEPVFVDGVQILFGRDESSRPKPIGRYRVEVLWDGTYVPVVVAVGNTQLTVSHSFRAVLTTSVRVVLGEAGGLAEVSFSRLNVIPSTTTSFSLGEASAGAYSVSAVDTAGAEGPAVSVDLGDAVPSAPTGLSAVVEGATVTLTWQPNPEPDIARYVVFRDGVPIASAASPSFVDTRSVSGHYEYAVAAVDLAGQMSGWSSGVVASVTVAETELEAPVLTVPTVAGAPIAVSQPLTDVAGHARAGSLVSLYVNGTQTGTVAATPSAYVAADTLEYAPEVSYYPGSVNVVLSRDGRRVAQAGGARLWITDRALGTTSEIAPPAGYGYVFEPDFSPDGSRLVYAAVTTSWDGGDLFVLDLDRGTTTALDVPGDRLDFVARWSPEGTRLAITQWSGWQAEVVIYDLATRERSAVFQRQTAWDLNALRWSPDGSRLAFAYWPGDTEAEPADSAIELHVVAVLGESQFVVAGAGKDETSWSPDGQRLAYSTNVVPRRVVVRDVTTGATENVTVEGVDSFRPAFEPVRGRLSYVTTPAGNMRRFVIRDENGGVQAVGDAVAVDDGRVPSAHQWERAGTLMLSGPDHIAFFKEEESFLFEDVALRSGENRITARAADASSLLTSSESAPILVTVPADLFADPAVTSADIGVFPVAPTPGQASLAFARVRNAGKATASDVRVRISIADAQGSVLADNAVVLASLTPGATGSVSVSFVPSGAGIYTIVVQVDPLAEITEAREDNNEAVRSVAIGVADEPVVTTLTDKTSYGANETAILSTSIRAGGAAFAGIARAVVLDAAGQLVALVNERAVSLAPAEGVEYSLTWNTAQTFAGAYQFRVELVDGTTGAIRAAATAPFTITAEVSVTARVAASRAQVTPGAPVGFTANVENLSANSPVSGATATLAIQRQGSPDIAHQATTAVPLLLPGGQAALGFTWPSATPVGTYIAKLEVGGSGGDLLAQAQTTFAVTDVVSLRAVLALDPAHVLAGDPTTARATLTNVGSTAITDVPVTVVVTRPADGSPLLSGTGAVSLAVGESATVDVALDVAALEPGPYPVLLRAGTNTSSLARTVLWVHGAIVAPTVHSPAIGATVGTATPTLTVNNAQSIDGSELTYEFEVFSDQALSEHVARVAGRPQGTERTTWTIETTLSEDQIHYWRARAHDGFSSSPWTEIGSFLVNAVNAVPAAPVLDYPTGGAKVAVRRPTLRVHNVFNDELETSAYEFQVFGDEARTQLVAASAGVAEGLEGTHWQLAVDLAEDTTYYWTARVSDGVNVSPWSSVGRFVVDTENASPSAPSLVRPVVGAVVGSLSPDLVVNAAADTEGDTLRYLFEIDTRASFDSPARQASALLAELSGQASWSPTLPLSDDTRYYWRAAAHDGTTQGPWVVGELIVSLVNDPPAAPVLLAPADGEIVTTATPLLRVRNATDTEGDVLRYDFVVRDENGAVASVESVTAGELETAWTVDTSLAENGHFVWSARARDAEAAGPWSAESRFRVNAVDEPPTAPTLVSPAEGAILATRRPTLVVGNAFSPEGRTLAYRFELYRETDAGLLPVASAEVPEAADQTSWPLVDPLADGPYVWRVQAYDGVLSGPWTAGARFEIAVLIQPPQPVSPVDGATVTVPQPALIVSNAVSSDAAVLTYELEVYADAALTERVASAVGVAETANETTWVVNVALAESAGYYWRARAHDGFSNSPWTAVSRFALDLRPAPPTGLGATVDDRSVTLTWNRNPETDVVAYEVHRGLATGGPYALAGAIAATATSFQDTGLANGTTYYYVVRALDARFESLFSAEVSATPRLGLEGTIAVTPDHVLQGTPSTAAFTVTNTSAGPRSGLILAVEVVNAGGAVAQRHPATVDLASNQTHTGQFELATGTLASGAYTVRLRAGSPEVTLAEATLHVHGIIVPPSIDSPADGARVAAARPVLTVNNGVNPDGEPLTYVFEVYGDVALTQRVATAAGIAETPSRTSWTVSPALQENQTYYWRARAADSFSASAWTSASSFMVDVVNEAPSVPVPDAPAAGARVATRQPTLVVTSSSDPERDTLTYDFRLAADPALTQVIVSVTGVPEGVGLTSWTVPTTLEENATYYWTARASDGTTASGWSPARSFIVDTENEPPSAPVPVEPIGGLHVAALRPTLVADNARDPEGQPLTYVFEIDRVPTFDSPALQVSPSLSPGAAQTRWTVPAALLDDTTHYWRVVASDGHSQGPWSPAARFFVNLANDAPGVPTLLEPVDNQIMATSTPTLRLRNAADDEGDSLTYEFVVHRADGTVAASSGAIAAGADETTWTVATPLDENAAFTWSARARDGQANGLWAPSEAFRVNAVADPPTAPVAIAPGEGEAVGTRRPALVVANATSPDQQPLVYTFELYVLAADGTTWTLVEQSAPIAEGADRTQWTPSADLADGSYSWRVRAVDGLQAGPWMPTAHFHVVVDVPPAAPTGLRATPGNGTVSLAWDASPEADVVSYRVYRGERPGGPYTAVATVAAPLHEDTDLANGVPVYYVVTARDGRFESAYSAEITATPIEPPPSLIRLEVRLSPNEVDGACVACPMSSSCGSDGCPVWLYATLEPESTVAASAIPLESVRLAGSVAADPRYRFVVDEDRDGRMELKVRFAWNAVAPWLSAGENALALTARVQAVDLRGTADLAVSPVGVKIRFTPRTFNKRSRGREVQVVQLTLPCRLRAEDVEIASILLNEQVPVSRVLGGSGQTLYLKFDRAALAAVLPTGPAVEIRLTGTVKDFPFLGRDVIKVQE